MAQKSKKTFHPGGDKAARKSNKTSTKSAPASRGGRAKRSPSPAKSVGRAAPGRKTSARSTSRPIREGFSLDRKLDILGIGMTLVGLLTLLSWLSPIQGALTGGWTSGLAKAFGWGRYLFPFGLMLIGLWLVLRKFERIPQFAVERILGLILLFVNLLGVLHFTAMLDSGESSTALAQAGRGGGYLGGLVTGALGASLGTGGMAIVLAAWLVVALVLSLDITVAELVGWIPPLATRMRDWWIETLEERRNHRAALLPPAPAASSPPFLGQSSASLPHAVPPFQAAPLPASILPAFTPETPGPTVRREWVLPAVEQILDEGRAAIFDEQADQQRARLIEETLNSFGAPSRVVEINRGPVITQFGVEPDFVESRGGRMRVRVSKIAALADDLALALSARTIRIQAPVPGKGFIGIEVPNDEIALVALRDLVVSEAIKRIKSPLRFALGLNVAGNAIAADLSAMPHLLIAGATGSGKSVCVNALISCLLIHNTPDDLRLLMVDPKRVELTNYNGIPHLLAPVVVELERVVSALQWVSREMDMRYRKLAEAGCRNIQEYNSQMAAQQAQKLPYLVVIIDELADLMMLAPDETERTLTRLAQLARATGIHLVIATQRPSVDVVTGLIKANFPARIAFAVASMVDSRVILDQPGAERLLGRGDMLFQAPDAAAPVRLQGVFVSDSESQRLVSYWQNFAGVGLAAPTAAGGIVDAAQPGLPMKQMPMWEEIHAEEDADPLFNEAVDLARRQGRASISMLQRRLRIGYTRAARLVETMEEKGIVGPPDPGTGTREILDYGQAAPPVDDV